MDFTPGMLTMMKNEFIGTTFWRILWARIVIKLQMDPIWCGNLALF